MQVLSKSKVIFNDDGLKDLKKAMKSVRILVGLPKGTPTNEDYQGLTVIEVGAANEFGVPSKNIPARSFIREPLFKNEAKFRKVAQRIGVSILDGSNSFGDGVDEMGGWGQGIIKNSFSDNNWTPLKPATVKAKKSKNSNPLLDTGNLRQSITWEIAK